MMMTSSFLLNSFLINSRIVDFPDPQLPKIPIDVERRDSSSRIFLATKAISSK